MEIVPFQSDIKAFLIMFHWEKGNEKLILKFKLILVENIYISVLLISNIIKSFLFRPY